MLKCFCIAFLLILSCSTPTEKPEIVHNFQLRLDLSQLPASVSSIRGQLSNSNSDLIVFDFDFDTITETATTTISEIPVGEWTLTVNALDEDEIVTHSASTTILIHSGLNEVNLVFEAVTGDLISIVEFPADSIFRRIHTYKDPSTNQTYTVTIYYSQKMFDGSVKIAFSQPAQIFYGYTSRSYYCLDSDSNYYQVGDELYVEFYPQSLSSEQLLTIPINRDVIPDSIDGVETEILLDFMINGQSYYINEFEYFPKHNKQIL